MPHSYIETNFDEKSGIISCPTEWGSWWQTVNEVHIEINVPLGTKGKAVEVLVKPTHITVTVAGKQIIKGNLYSVIKEDETIWTLEDQMNLSIVLVKTDPIEKDVIWKGLLKDSNLYMADPYTLHKMGVKMELEMYQMQNLGFDFSRAELQKCYDSVPC